MAMKRHSTEQIVRKLREAEVELAKRGRIKDVIFLSLSGSALRAQDPSANSGRARVPVGSAAAVTEAPIIDGRLDDAAWKGAPVLADFVQRESVEGEPMS